MSGIYIPGMEMPQEGCAVAMIFSDGETRVYTGKPVSVIKCKAVPVSPHGRLIEKGALLDKCYQHYEDFMLGKVDGKTALLNIEKEIKAAPTIIPADKEEQK